MKKIKLMTFIGTRPEIIRLAEVIKECDRNFEHILVHTGQNWDFSLNDVFFQDFNLRAPDHFLNVVGKNLGETMGNILAKTYDILVQEKPDAVLVLGDTNSCLSVISAKRLKIPIFHMEAGNRCFDMNVPEEINRRIVDHTSDINLAYTEHARRYLISEGITKNHIIVTGSPMFEVINRNKDKIEASQALKKFDVKPQEYFVLSTHREENVDIEKNFRKLVHSINTLCETYKKTVLFSCHPRTSKKIKELSISLHPLVKVFEPISFTDYLKLQKNSFCVLSDSGTLSEESIMLGFPAVLLRTSTERPEAIDSGHIIYGSLDADSLTAAVEQQTKPQSGLVAPLEYTQDYVSKKVVKAIASYTSVINRVTWNKEI